MISKSIAQFALFAALGILIPFSSVSAQDPGGADRFFGFLDRNQDGRLDRDEMQRMPGSFRESIERSEINLSNGISRQDFTRLMDEARRRREEEYRNRDQGDRSRDQSDEDRRREYYRRREEERNREESRRREDEKKSSYVYTQPKHDPVTMKIPRNFEDGDTDKDGQIGLYEWRQWRPQEKYHFRVYDIDGDGFLTPKELSIPPTQEEINNYLTSIGIKIDTTTSSRSSRYGGRSRDGGSRDGGYRESSGPSQPQVAATPASPQPVAKPAEEDKVAKVAMIFFKSMDVDKSGTITSEEWARSEKLKPKFEKAGYDLSQPMDEQQFITAYREAESKS